MTNSSTIASANLSKFQGMLRALFQFDCADLDFGIYRIMNHKRDAVERFINEQLPTAISTELDSGTLAGQAKAEANLAEKAQQVRSTLGADAIDDSGELIPKHRGLPIGQEYMEAQQQAAGSRSRDAVEAAIYNHLYTFFSRYYEDGDFISKRRYSRNQRYAIPYNGEEVYLHWANNDQYYVKSDEYFQNYDWKAPNEVVVHFRLKNADVEQNNVKGTGNSSFRWSQRPNGTLPTTPSRFPLNIDLRPVKRPQNMGLQNNKTRSSPTLFLQFRNNCMAIPKP